MRKEWNDILIRDALPSDAPILCRWWNDGAVMAHAGFPNGLGTTVEEIEKQQYQNTGTGTVGQYPCYQPPDLTSQNRSLIKAEEIVDVVVLGNHGKKIKKRRTQHHIKHQIGDAFVPVAEA